MATRIAWLLNLDADLELRDATTYRGLALSTERVRELSARMFDLVAADDVMLDARKPLADIDHTLAFCPTPDALTKITALGLTPPPAPSVDALRLVNDRRFCAQLGQTLPRAAFVDDMQALEQHIATPSPTGVYVIKRAFSFAGREQRRVHDGLLDDSTRGFCARSFDDREGVQVEPWVDRLMDCAKHGYLRPDATLLVGNTRAQQVDAMGRFQHMIAATEIRREEAAMLDAELRSTGKALHEAGYFGPFGIDAFRYRLPDGATAFNPRCEINARFTMGYPRELLLRALPLKGFATTP